MSDDMDQHDSTHWRQRFGLRGAEPPPNGGHGAPFGMPGHPSGRSAPSTPPHPLGGYDDGFDPARHAARALDAAHGPGEAHSPLSPEDLTDEAAIALAMDMAEYKPWVVQRGRSRPAMMLHLRRYEPKSGLWQGWQIAYPHLIAVEYTGDKLLSLDFGTRQFIIEGTGLDELARHLQLGSVLMVQEFSAHQWPALPPEARIRRINNVGSE